MAFIWANFGLLSSYTNFHYKIKYTFALPKCVCLYQLKMKMDSENVAVQKVA